MTVTNTTTNHIEVGGLYQTTADGLILAYKNDQPERSEFRMKPEYVFTIIEEVEFPTRLYKFVRVLMANTGKFQLLHKSDLEIFLSRNFIKRIG
jgi:hypothetical protein